MSSIFYYFYYEQYPGPTWTVHFIIFKIMNSTPRPAWGRDAWARANSWRVSIVLNDATDSKCAY